MYWALSKLALGPIFSITCTHCTPLREEGLCNSWHFLQFDSYNCLPFSSRCELVLAYIATTSSGDLPVQGLEGSAAGVPALPEVDEEFEEEDEDEGAGEELVLRVASLPPEEAVILVVLGEQLMSTARPKPRSDSVNSFFMKISLR